MSEDINTPATAAETRTTNAAGTFAEAVELMRRLRAADGCPWDREQTLDSIRRYTVEEVYEVLDAIDRSNWKDLREELGDLLLQILFYAQIAEDEGHFDIADVLEGLNLKLVRRHPHVFGETASMAAGNAAVLAEGEVTTATHVLRNWEAIKKAEKAAVAMRAESLMATVPRTFPALLEAAKLGSKAAKVGFDWPSHEGVLDKLREEVVELQEAADLQSKDRDSCIEEELGDLLFTAANLARHFKVDPEVALRAANAKFRERFARLEHAGSLDAGLSSAELEARWAAAKVEEKQSRL